mmetsp:Transcript_52955/g.113524  ORF Transcript_52955/g.113524 Transcript_52955/m.113524 type:complete len:339 (+) Transcript_52955:140-1156(+)
MSAVSPIPPRRGTTLRKAALLALITSRVSWGSGGGAMSCTRKGATSEMNMVRLWRQDSPEEEPSLSCAPSSSSSSSSTSLPMPAPMPRSSRPRPTSLTGAGSISAIPSSSSSSANSAASSSRRRKRRKPSTTLLVQPSKKAPTTRGRKFATSPGGSGGSAAASTSAPTSRRARAAAVKPVPAARMRAVRAPLSRWSKLALPATKTCNTAGAVSAAAPARRQAYISAVLPSDLSCALAWALAAKSSAQSSGVPFLAASISTVTPCAPEAVASAPRLSALDTRFQSPLCAATMISAERCALICVPVTAALAQHHSASEGAFGALGEAHRDMAGAPAALLL